MSLDAMKLALDALCDFDYDKRQLAIAALRAAIEQAEKQEPVAWMHKETGLLRREISRPKGADWDANYWEPLYTAPRQWQGLTKKEFLAAVDGLEDLEDCWVAIEAKLKDKNG